MDWFDVLEDDDTEVVAPGGRKNTDDEIERLQAQNKYELPTGYLSVSQVGLYNKCAHRYYEKYVLGKRFPGTATMAHGRLCHNIFEELNIYKLEHDQEVPPEEMGQDLISQRFHEFFVEIEEWHPRIPNAEHAERTARQIVELFRTEVMPGQIIRAAEQQIVEPVRGIPFLGYVDVVLVGEANQDLEARNPTLDKTQIKPGDIVRDYKVTGKNYGKHRVINSLQLSIYAGLLRVRDVGYDLLVDRSTNKNATDPVYKPHNATRTDKDIRHAYDVVEDTARAISAGIFPRTDPEHWMCSEKWCPYFDGCRGSA